MLWGAAGIFLEYDEEQKAAAARLYNQLFDEAVKTAAEEDYDLLVIDEFISAYNHGFIDQKKALHFFLNRPEHLEVVLTGREPGEELLELADYVTEMRKVKHPFDQGIPARKGNRIIVDRTELYRNCRLCPRECKVDRRAGKTGFCGMTSEVMAARAALHFWEEPCIPEQKDQALSFSPAVPFAVSFARITRSQRER